MVDEGAPTVFDFDDESLDRRRQSTAEFGRAMNGTYAGLNVEVTATADFYGHDEDGEPLPGVRAGAAIRDENGNQVGKVERAFYRDRDGNLVAYHNLLQLDPEVQGRGFATEFNAHLEEWYREQGVSRIELDANIDVGGMAWARRGFDFADAESADRIAGRLRRYASDNRSPADVAAAEAILERMDRTPFGSPGYPTPFQISEIGRTPGSESWLGRDVMLGSYWSGVRWL